MILSKTNAEHFTWGNNCDGWHLLKSNKLSIIEEKMPPDTSEQLHYHNKAQQVFYILSGIATFEIDGQTQTVKANESIHIESNHPHKISNMHQADLCFLVISEPMSHGDRVNL